MTRIGKDDFMSKYVYPAIFTNDPEGISVHFPDFENCFTSGENVVEAIEMANDVLAFVLSDMEDKGLSIPNASLIKTISTNENEFTSYVFCDTKQVASDSLSVSSPMVIQRG